MQQKREINKKEGYCTSEEPMVTDMLATLFGELAAMFNSFSKIARTVVGLKEQLGNMQKTHPGSTIEVIENYEDEGENNV